MSPSPYTAYNRATHTVSKTRQVVMLYEGAIRFLQQAIDAMTHHDAELQFQKLNHVGEIVLALQAALDLKYGGEQAKGLYEFYANIDTRILSLHRSSDTVEGTHILDELRTMRDVWDAIDREDKSA